MSRTTTTPLETLSSTPLKQAFGLSTETLDHAMATAYQLYQSHRFSEAEILCRGLLAADPGYWWCYSLYAAILRRQGRLRQAITLLDRGLAHEPAQAKLLAMRAETQAAIDALSALSAKANHNTRAGQTRNETQAAVREVV